jgi:hypothetical protein
MKQPDSLSDRKLRFAEDQAQCPHCLREDSHLLVDAHAGRTRGRDEDCSSPPAQIPACGFPAPGSISGRTRSAFGVLGTHAAPIRVLVASVRDLIRRCVRDLRCNQPFPRPASVPPPSPPPVSPGIVRGFAGTMGPSDSRFRRSRPPIPSLKPPGVPISLRPWFQFEATRGSDFKPPRVIIRAGQV